MEWACGRVWHHYKPISNWFCHNFIYLSPKTRYFANRILELLYNLCLSRKTVSYEVNSKSLFPCHMQVLPLLWALLNKDTKSEPNLSPAGLHTIWLLIWLCLVFSPFLQFRHFIIERHRLIFFFLVIYDIFTLLKWVDWSKFKISILVEYIFRILSAPAILNDSNK